MERGRPRGLRGRFFAFLHQNPGVWFEFPEIRKSGLGVLKGEDEAGIRITTRNSDENGNRYLTADKTPGVKIWGRYDAPEQ